MRSAFRNLKTARIVFATLALAAATGLLLFGLSQGRAQAPDATETLAPPPIQESAQATPAIPNLGPDPLTKEDTKAVMTWIAAKMAVEKLPYCYRQSYGRGAGETLSKSCSGDLDKDGLLCYPKCRSGHVGKGPVCWASCPDGFKDIGAFCQKPKPYGRGAGYPWKIGDKLGSLDAARKRCAKDHSQGCEKDGEIIYPKCRNGFHKVGCCTCSPNCPSGWADSGTGCTKPSYGRGAGEPLACKPGLERDGLLCYPACKPGYHGVGPVCWQNCPSQSPKECGAGCSKTVAECATSTTDMVITPVMCAASLATFGQASGAGAGARAAEEGAEAAAKAAKLRKLYQSAETGVKVASGGATIGQATADQILLFSDLYAKDFEHQTTKEIAREIDARFGPKAQLQVKRRWAACQLALMMQSNGIATAQNVLAIASVEPTGLVAVASAYMKPICDNNTPFPTVHPLITD